MLFLALYYVLGLSLTHLYVIFLQLHKATLVERFLKFLGKKT